MTSGDAPYELQRLSSGARLIATPMRERRSAAVAFMFGVGSRYEVGATAGLSHFIEHVVFKGGGRFPTARAVSEAIESVGGSINASTDKEATIFDAKVPSRAHEAGLPRCSPAWPSPRSSIPTGSPRRDRW